MKEADAKIRALGRSFDLFDRSRREMDKSTDDLARADIDRQWLGTARSIMAHHGYALGSWRIKSRVLLGLIVATGAQGVAIEAASSNSCAASIEKHRSTSPCT